MSQHLSQSESGPIVTKPFIDGFARVLVSNEESLEILSRSPEKTVWGGAFGRPVYDRLPGVSEGYRKEYAGEENRGVVFIDPQFGTVSGPGSLQVGAWEEDPRVLVVYNGTITWANGQIETETLAVNLESIIQDGVQDGDYQVGYYLNLEPQEDLTFSKFRIENSSLGGSITVFEATREAKYHPIENAIGEERAGSWKPAEFAKAGDYPDGTFITFDFTEAVVAENFSVVARNGSATTANCALYRSDDAISWYLEDSVKASAGAWTLVGAYTQGSQYYRLFFWGGDVEVEEVKYTGEAIFPNRRPIGPVSTAELFMEGLFDEIDRPYILLAIVTVRNFEIEKITDKRTTSTAKYEPVAKWLTDFQDVSLKSVFTSVEKYSEKYLSPQIGAFHFYDDLLRSDFTFQSETETPKIHFPSRIENIEDMTPRGVILLLDPEQDSDLATKVFSDITLVPSLDNGQY
jgi:hypothetical protein